MLTRGLHTGQLPTSQGLRTARIRPERQVTCNSRRYGQGYNGGMSYDSSDFLSDAIRTGVKALGSSLEEMKRAQEEMEKARQEGTAPSNPDQKSGPGTAPVYESSRSEFDRWARMAAEWKQQSPYSGEVVVAVDVEEYDDSYALWMDVPGMQKEDVKIQVSPSMRTITISGERKRAATEPSGRVRHERKMGSFSRTVRLAKDLDASTISARVDRGVLQVTAKKHPVIEPECDALEISIE